MFIDPNSEMTSMKYCLTVDIEFIFKFCMSYCVNVFQLLCWDVTELFSKYSTDSSAEDDPIF